MHCCDIWLLSEETVSFGAITLLCPLKRLISKENSFCANCPSRHTSLKCLHRGRRLATSSAQSVKHMVWELVELAFDSQPWGGEAALCCYNNCRPGCMLAPRTEAAIKAFTCHVLADGNFYLPWQDLKEDAWSFVTQLQHHRSLISLGKRQLPAEIIRSRLCLCSVLSSIHRLNGLSLKPLGSPCKSTPTSLLLLTVLRRCQKSGKPVWEGNVRGRSSHLYHILRGTQVGRKFLSKCSLSWG